MLIAAQSTWQPTTTYPILIMNLNENMWLAETLELENPNLVQLSKQQETHIFGLELVLHVVVWPFLCCKYKLNENNVQISSEKH